MVTNTEKKCGQCNTGDFAFISLPLYWRLLQQWKIPYFRSRCRKNSHCTTPRNQPSPATISKIINGPSNFTTSATHVHLRFGGETWTASLYVYSITYNLSRIGIHQLFVTHRQSPITHRQPSNIHHIIYSVSRTKRAHGRHLFSTRLR